MFLLPRTDRRDKKARGSRGLRSKVRVRGFRVLLVFRRGRDRVLKVRLNDLQQQLAAAELLHGAEIKFGATDNKRSKK